MSKDQSREELNFKEEEENNEEKPKTISKKYFIYNKKNKNYFNKLIKIKNINKI